MFSRCKGLMLANRKQINWRAFGKMWVFHSCVSEGFCRLVLCNFVLRNFSVNVSFVLGELCAVLCSSVHFCAVLCRSV